MNTIEIRFKDIRIDNNVLYALSLDGRIYSYSPDNKTWILIPGPEVSRIPPKKTPEPKSLVKKTMLSKFGEY